MRIIYRISDNSNPRDRVATKQECLRNFLNVWYDLSGVTKNGNADEVTILMDNISDATKGMIMQATRVYRECGLDLHLFNISGGSSEKSFRAAMGVACENTADDVYVYLVEDDYLHLPDARAVMLEGLQRADYVTLYDHPDKYVAGSEEATRVILTTSTHWKQVRSTTATFACTAGVLKQDRELWTLCTAGHRGAAWDNVAFTQLTSLRYRTLISPIPGFSTHAELAWLSPHIRWRASCL